jgi:prolipoprotein diacylglyceryltransferase
MVSIKVKTPSARSYDREIMKTTVDICRLQDGVIGNFIAKLVYETLQNLSNYNFECPVKKDVYYIRNFQVPTSILPLRLYSVILQGENFFNFTLIVKARIAKVKGLAQLWAANLYGSFVSNN